MSGGGGDCGVQVGDGRGLRRKRRVRFAACTGEARRPGLQRHEEPAGQPQRSQSAGKKDTNWEMDVPRPESDGMYDSMYPCVSFVLAGGLYSREGSPHR